jgi:hypothetical protein
MSSYTINALYFFIAACLLIIAGFVAVAWKGRNKHRFMDSREWKTKQATEKWMSER